MIPLFKVFMSGEAVSNCAKTLASGYIAQGPQVDMFEEALAKYFDPRGKVNIVTLNSCTSAIELALHLIKTQYLLPDGTEVLSSPVTCFATNGPIVHNRMDIKWCDINPDTFNIEPLNILAKLSETTRILIYVHWGGSPVNSEHIKKVKEHYRAKYKRELYVIEDCAHAFGSKVGLTPVGYTDPENYSVFSFQAIKTLTTGDGGLLITPDETYKLARRLRWFGLDRDNKVNFRHCQDIKETGFKYHMNDVQASIGLGNLPHVDSLIKRQQINAGYYNKFIKNERVGIKLPLYENTYSWWLYTLLVDNSSKFIEYMRMAGVECNAVHTRNDKFSCLREFYRDKLPNVDSTESRRVAVPNGWWLSEENLKYITQLVNEY